MTSVTRRSIRLTAREERRLLELAAEGEAAAKQRLIEAHMGLIRAAVRRFRGYGDDDDLVQAGTLGLLTAISRFDLKRTVRLSTFALPHILGEVRRQAHRASSSGMPDSCEHLAGVQGPDDMGSVEERLCVRDAVRLLPPLERALVLWRYYAQRSQMETAGLLGISQAQVSRLERAARLRIGRLLVEGGNAAATTGEHYPTAKVGGEADAVSEGDGAGGAVPTRVAGSGTERGPGSVDHDRGHQGRRGI